MPTQTEILIQDIRLEVNTLKERVESLRSEIAPLRGITNQIAVIEHKGVVGPAGMDDPDDLLVRIVFLPCGHSWGIADILFQCEEVVARR